MDTWESQRVIEALRQKLADDEQMAGLLVDSLRMAKELAKRDLDEALYDALWWPTEIAREHGYLAYLTWFARWRPVQSDHRAWLAPGTAEHQEVYDRLTHFYFLVDQPVEGTKVVESLPWFKAWLVDYAKAWGSFLDTTASFDEQLLRSFLHEAPKYRVQDSLKPDGRPNAPSGWLTFNQFFARELNPGLRPISSPMDNKIVTSSADCTFKAMYRIDNDSRIPEIEVKGTHRFASVEDLLAGSPYRGEFRNGVYVHYFLGPYSYHRFHAPVSGTLLECRSVPGLVYLDVSIRERQFDAPDGATGGYEFTQARGITVFDTRGSPYGDVGLVASIPIGMAQVSSVNLTATVGAQMLKGDEYGYFLFGGSDTILLFQSRANAQVIQSGSEYVLYGNPVALCHP